jgi:hypothetical protein
VTKKFAIFELFRQLPVLLPSKMPITSVAMLVWENRELTPFDNEDDQTCAPAARKTRKSKEKKKSYPSASQVDSDEDKSEKSDEEKSEEEKSDEDMPIFVDDQSSVVGRSRASSLVPTPQQSVEEDDDRSTPSSSSKRRRHASPSALHSKKKKRLTRKSSSEDESTTVVQSVGAGPSNQGAARKLDPSNKGKDRVNVPGGYEGAYDQLYEEHYALRDSYGELYDQHKALLGKVAEYLGHLSDADQIAREYNEQITMLKEENHALQSKNILLLQNNSELESLVNNLRKSIATPSSSSNKQASPDHLAIKPSVAPGQRSPPVLALDKVAKIPSNTGTFSGTHDPKLPSLSQLVNNSQHD